MFREDTPDMSVLNAVCLLLHWSWQAFSS